MEQSAEFFREKATQCRELAEGASSETNVARGLEAMALEFDACAVAIEAGKATARQIDHTDAVSDALPPT